MEEAELAFLNRVPGGNKNDDDFEKAHLASEFRHWLEENVKPQILAVSARAAARFRGCAAFLEDVEDRELIELATLRCSINSCVAAWSLDLAITEAASQAAKRYEQAMERIRNATSKKRGYSAGRTPVVVNFAACFAAANSDPTEFAMRAIYYGPRGASAGSYEATRQDMLIVEQLADASDLFSYPLWHDVDDRLLEADKKTQQYWEASTGDWGFWQRWSNGIYSGNPIDWEIQRAVALLPDHDWELGPTHIACKVQEIEARFELQNRISDLEKELALATETSRLGIGGNNPPESIVDAPEIAKDFEFIWTPLQQLKNEIKAKEPDQAYVSRLISMLQTGLAHGIKWCASKIDLAVDTTIKWGIPAAGGGYFAMNPDKLSAVIEAAEKWLAALQFP